MKNCSRCGDEKPLVEFYRNRNHPDGHTTYCRACSNSYVAEWKRQHPERVREWARRDSARPERKAAKRAHENAARKRCPDCGQPMGAGSGYLSKGAALKTCGDCKVRAARERTERFIALRGEGLNNRMIAEREDCTPHVVACVLSRASRYGLEVPPPPYWSRAKRTSDRTGKLP
jgi:hypothetical protein